METEPGDEFLRRFASFIRTHEQRLADAGYITRPPRAQPQAGSYNLLSWLNPVAGSTNTPARPSKPTVLSTDPHHLFYLLSRMEALGLAVGSLDVKLETPLKPAPYLTLLSARDKSDVMSITSFRSTLSAVSKLSLGPSLGWLTGPAAPPPSLDSELKYMYSALTKLPSLLIHGNGLNLIAELANDPPNDTALPLDVFKNLQSLELTEVDARDFTGWDQMSIGLRSLTIRKSGIEDVSDILVDAVIDDQARRRGELKTPLRNRRRIVHRPSASLRSRQSSIVEESTFPPEDEAFDVPTTSSLPSYAWASLRHLALSDNSLTFFLSTPLPFLVPLQSLDLSNNLLVSVPPCLSGLPSLISLNLSHNMLDSILNISSLIPSIRTLNLAQNRLDSLCGLERLQRLERVDLRGNRVEQSDEVGRLAQCQNVKEVWVEENPFCRTETDWRLKCFEYFQKEGLNVLLDGAGPSFNERRYITSPPRPSPMRAPSQVPVPHPPATLVTSSANASPMTTASRASKKSQPTPPILPTPSPSVLATPNDSPRPKRRKQPAKRIVNLDGPSRDPSPQSVQRSLAPPAPTSRGQHSKSKTDQAGRQAADASAAHLRSVSSSPQNADADAFRAHIEALREEVGESWLRVLSQSSELGGGAPRGGGKAGKVGT